MTLYMPGCPSTGGMGTVSTHLVNEPQRCTCGKASCHSSLDACLHYSFPWQHFFQSVTEAAPHPGMAHSTVRLPYGHHDGLIKGCGHRVLAAVFDSNARTWLPPKRQTNFVGTKKEAILQTSRHQLLHEPLELTTMAALTHHTILNVQPMQGHGSPYNL